MVSDGARQLRLLARDLDRAGKELRMELPKALKRAAAPMVEAIRADARERLPHRGGLAEYVAKATISVQVRTGANNASARLVGRRKQTRAGGQVDLPAINRGRLRHPTYGHGPWVTQTVPAGFWDDGVTHAQGAVDRELQAALDQVRRRIEQSGI